MRRVRTLILASACTLATLALPTSGEAIVVGELADSINEACDGKSNSFVQAKSARGHKSFRVPRNGVITSWAHNSRGISGSKLKLKIFRPLRGGRFKMIGQSTFERMDDVGVISNRTRIRVHRGDVLGLGSAGNAGSSPTSCFDPGGFRGDREYARAEDIRRGQIRRFPAGPFQVRLNVRATLRPSSGRSNFSRLHILRAAVPGA